MRFLMTGGTGLIGTEFIRSAINSNMHSNKHHHFVVLTRQNLANETHITYIQSVDDISLHAPYDVIINLAGEPIADKRWTNIRKEKLMNSRVKLTHSLVNAVAQLQVKPQLFISGSAVGWYGSQSDTPLSETSAPNTSEFSHHLCQAWEEAAMKANTLGIRTCIIRTGLVLSSFGGFLSRLLLPFKCGLGGPLGNGKQFMSWIHIHDMINILWFLIKQETLTGEFNATAPNAVDNQTFTQTLAHILKRPAFFRLPEKLLQFGMGEMSTLLTKGQNVHPQKLLDARFKFAYPHLEAALENIIIKTSSR